MLYFSHMNLPRSASTESTKNNTLPGISQDISILLDELSPFGLFLSQFLYMASWLFPGNSLPDSIKTTANLLETPDQEQHKKIQIEERDNDLS